MDYLTQENGDKILQETGYGILLELSDKIQTYDGAVTLTLSPNISFQKFLHILKEVTITLSKVLINKISIEINQFINLNSSISAHSLKLKLLLATITLSAANSIWKSLTRTYSATLTLTAGIVKKISRLLEATITLGRNLANKVILLLESTISLGVSIDTIFRVVKQLSVTITLSASKAISIIYGLILKATITLSISIGKIINAIRMIPKIIGAFFNNKPLNSNIDSNNKPKTYR